MAEAKVDDLKRRQEEEREALQQRHAVEIEKFHLWVEAEIMNACHQLPPDPSDNTRARLAHNASACDYFLKQRYGRDVFIDRSKSQAPPDTDLVRTLLSEKNMLLQRHQYEADALKASQLLEWADEIGIAYPDPASFPKIPVVDFSLESMAPKPEDLLFQGQGGQGSGPQS